MKREWATVFNLLGRARPPGVLGVGLGDGTGDGVEICGGGESFRGGRARPPVTGWRYTYWFWFVNGMNGKK